MIPPPSEKACDFVLQFKFPEAHIPGKMKTSADFSSHLESNPIETIIPQIKGDVHTQTIEVNIESKGRTQEDQVLLHKVYVELR